MKKFLFVLTVALLCNSFVVLSQTQEGDIELTEWEIYSPRDSNHHGNKPKTCATCFSASHSGSTLSVTNSTSQTARVVVTSLTSFNVVVSRDWVGTTTEQLPQDSYEIVIYTDDGALGGWFDVE